MKPTAPLHNHDPLEAFVRQNRRAFDSATPAADLWARIEAELGQPLPQQNPLGTTATPLVPARPHRILRPALWQAAATIALLAGFFWLVGQPVPQREGAPQASISLEQYSNELAQADAAYGKLISQRRAEIVSLRAYEPELVDEFLKDLDELDAGYYRLREELTTAPNTEAVIRAMIQNLRLRIDVLSRQLEVLERIKANHPDLSKPQPANTASEVRV